MNPAVLLNFESPKHIPTCLIDLLFTVCIWQHIVVTNVNKH